MMSVLQSCIFYALMSEVALAQDNSTTDNNQSDKMIGWVSPAPRRTTWSIIWSCLSIFIVCSWKCVHLNIPTHEEAKGEWHTLQIKFLPDISVWPKAPLRRKWSRKVIWMCLIALAPEFGVAMAVQQYIKARKDLKDTNEKRSEKLKQKYTMAHAFYVQMGGIVIYDVPNSTTTHRSSSEGDSLIDPAALSTDPAGLVHDTTSEISGPSIPQGRMITSLAKLDDMGVNISEHEIKDLSKADIITKAFAIIQCTWLTVQCIARSAQGYAISQLELGTLGFIFCAFIMHIFWWYKPFEVESRRVLPQLPPSGVPSRFAFSLSMDDLTESDPELLKHRMPDLDDEGVIDFIYGITDQDVSLTERLNSSSFYLTAIGFSVIHLLAWNWKFPTLLIQQLWRWFNISAATASVLPVAIMKVDIALDLSPRMTDASLIAIFVVGVLYALLRLGVLGLTFYCLTSMPERTYTTMDWLAWIPHFS